MAMRYLPTILCHFIFGINSTEIKIVSSYWSWLLIDTIEWYGIEIDVLVQVVALTPQSADIATGAVDVDAHILECSDKGFKLLFVPIGEFQRDDKEVAIATNGA